VGAFLKNRNFLAPPKKKKGTGSLKIASIKMIPFNSPVCGKDQLKNQKSES